MRLAEINDGLRSLFRMVILKNEIGGDLSLVYKFSDPDGVRTGKSGWSFGVCQYDINNNPNAVLALREMGFTTDEISGLKAQTVPIEPMNRKLYFHADVVDRYDDMQLNECLEWPLRLCNELGTDFSRLETFLHIADYHNQFYCSRGGKLYTWLKAQAGTPVTPEMVRDFKLSLPWGQKRPDDVNRRYSAISKIVREA